MHFLLSANFLKSPLIANSVLELHIQTLIQRVQKVRNHTRPDVLLPGCKLKQATTERANSLPTCTRGDQKFRGKVLLNRIAFIDCNENS